MRSNAHEAQCQPLGTEPHSPLSAEAGRKGTTVYIRANTSLMESALAATSQMKSPAISACGRSADLVERES